MHLGKYVAVVALLLFWVVHACFVVSIIKKLLLPYVWTIVSRLLLETPVFFAGLVNLWPKWEQAGKITWKCPFNDEADATQRRL